MWGWSEVVGGVGRGMGSLVFTYRQSVFDRALLQSCFEYPREVSLPISPDLHIHEAAQAAL